jgi:ABC-type branched-subunit amino acid transport system ATPase component
MTWISCVVVVEQNVDLALAHSDWAYVLIAGRNSLDGLARQIMQEDLASIFLGQAPPAHIPEC